MFFPVLFYLKWTVSPILNSQKKKKAKTKTQKDCVTQELKIHHIQK